MSGIKISKKTVVINSLSSALSLLLNLSVLVWLQQYLLKRITPEEYSLIPLINALLAFSPLLTMVLTDGLGRFTTIAYAKKDKDYVTRICSTMFPILLVAGIIFLIFGWIVAWHIDIILDIPSNYVHEAQLMMGLLVLLAAVKLPLSIFGSGMLISQKLYWQDMINLGCQLFRIALLFILLFGVDVRALWVTLALVSSELLRLLIETPLSLRLIPSQRVRKDAFSWATAKELIGYGGWGFINQIGETLKLSMDPILLNRFASATDVAIYNVSGIVPRQLLQLLTPLTRPFFPVIASFFASNDQKRLSNTYLRTARYHAWILIFFSVPIIIYSKELMHLYLDGKYDKSGLIMSILLVVAILKSFNALGPAIAQVSGFMKGIAIRQFSQQLLNLLFTVLFVVFMKKGVFGSAFASLLSGLILEVFIVWPFCRKLAFTSTKMWLKKVIYPTIFPAILPIAFNIIANRVFIIDSWLKLFSVCAISGLLYFLIVTIWFLEDEDKEDLRNLLNKIYKALKNLKLR